MKKAILWAVSLFLLLMSLGALASTSYLSALVSFIGFLLLLPPAQPFLETYTKRSLAIWHIFVLGIAFLCLSAILMPKSVMDRIEAEQKQRQEEQARKEEERLKLEAEEKEKQKARASTETKTPKEEKHNPSKAKTKYDADGNKVGETKEEAQRPTPRFGGLILTKADFGDEWALSVEWGEITCENSMVMFYAYGKEAERYAVNGTSKTEVRAGKAKDIDEIWLDDPQYKGIKSMQGTKISITPIMDKGLSICNQ